MTCGLLVTPQINNVSPGVLQEGNKSPAVVTESMFFFFFLFCFFFCFFFLGGGWGEGGLDSGHR